MYLLVGTAVLNLALDYCTYGQEKITDVGTLSFR